MIVVTVQGNDPERKLVARLLETAVQGSRLTCMRFGPDVVPPDTAKESDVRILERSR